MTDALCCFCAFVLLQVQKATAGSRELWLKLCKQAKHRNLKFEEWMEVKDKDNNMDSIPAHLR